MFAVAFEQELHSRPLRASMADQVDQVDQQREQDEQKTPSQRLKDELHDRLLLPHVSHTRGKIRNQCGIDMLAGSD